MRLENSCVRGATVKLRAGIRLHAITERCGARAVAAARSDDRDERAWDVSVHEVPR